MEPKVFTARWEDLSILAEREARSDREDIFASLVAPGDAGGEALYTHPILTDKFSTYLRDPDYGLLMTARFQDEIVGYLALRNFDNQSYIESLHVWEEHRRKGYGKLLVQKILSLPSRFSQHKRKVVSAAVRESDLSAQLFYKAVSFRCEKILRNFFDLPKEDAYLFRHRIN